MNEIAVLLAKPLPLGLMLVLFFVALAMFSLMLARVESKQRAVHAHYQEQLRAMGHHGGQSWSGAHHYSPLASSKSSWLGWFLAVALVGAAGIGLYVTQRPGAPALVVPDLAGMPELSPQAPSSAAMLKQSAVAAKVPASAPVLPPVAVPVRPTKAPVVAPAPTTPEPQAAPAVQAPAEPVQPAPEQAARIREDQDIERMLAWERQRAAQRRRVRSGGSARQSQRRAQRRDRPAHRRAEPAPAKPRPRSENPAVVTEPAPQAPVQEAPAPERKLRVPVPKKRRNRLKLDRSGDPLGSF